MHRYYTTLLAVLLLGFTASGLAAVNTQDSLALVDLYNSTAGPSWTDNTNWLTSEPVSNWYGVVTVSDSGRVIFLSFTGNNLNGPIPSSIQDLTLLTHLYCTNNSITSIPTEISALKNLQFMKLKNNQITSVPTGIGGLSELTNLDLQGNLISSLPAEIGRLTKLKEFSIASNQLTSLPDSMAKLSSIENLNLSYNQLTAFPEWIGDLNTLWYLFFSYNQISTLSDSIGKLNNLQFLYIDNNEITALPESIGDLSNLLALIAGFNQLTSLPPAVGSLSSLSSLELYDNQLTGLPTEIGDLSSLKALRLYNNQITALPQSIGQLASLTELRVENNKLTVFEPSLKNLKNLVKLYMDDNQITQFPDSLSKMTSLKDLYMGGNKLDTISFIIGDISVEELDLSYNNISFIAPAIGDVTTLKWLWLKNNKLKDLPDQIRNLAGGVYIYVNYNQLEFAPLERLLAIAAPSQNFVYKPQDTIGTVIDTVLQKGDLLNLRVDISGSVNVYAWYFKDEQGTTNFVGSDTTYLIDSYQPSQAGEYWCDVTNSNAPGLHLISGQYRIQNPLSAGDDDEGLMVKEFRLYANYPNPFNPSTTIVFDLPNSGWVELDVLNVLGQNVASLINKNMVPGSHKMEWNAANKPSGIYFMRLRASGKTAAKKMILIK